MDISTMISIGMVLFGLSGIVAIMEKDKFNRGFDVWFVLSIILTPVVSVIILFIIGRVPNKRIKRCVTELNERVLC